MVNQQANHRIVHHWAFRKTDRPTGQSLYPSAQVQMFTLDTLRLIFADLMNGCW